MCRGEAKIQSLFMNDLLIGILTLHGTTLLMLVTPSLYEDALGLYCPSTENLHTSYTQISVLLKSQSHFNPQSTPLMLLIINFLQYSNNYLQSIQKFLVSRNRMLFINHFRERHPSMCTKRTDIVSRYLKYLI